jgi:hypothetical protein
VLNVVPRLVDCEYVRQRTNRSAEIRPPKTVFLDRFRMPILRELSPGGSHQNAEGKLGEAEIKRLRREAPCSATGEEKILRVSPPAVDGLGPDQTWRLAFGSVAHLKRIAVCKVRGDIAVVGKRNIRAFLSQLDVVSVVFESMRKQTGSAIFAARHCSKQHGAPPKGSRISPILQTRRLCGKWSVCGKMCMLFCVVVFPAKRNSLPGLPSHVTGNFKSTGVGLEPNTQNLTPRGAPFYIASSNRDLH